MCALGRVFRVVCDILPAGPYCSSNPKVQEIHDKTDTIVIGLLQPSKVEKAWHQATPNTDPLIR